MGMDSSRNENHQLWHKATEGGGKVIKSIPGWLNFFLLWAFYYTTMWGIGKIFGAKFDLWYLGLITAVYAGSYLAKWAHIFHVDKDGKVIKDSWRFW
jgi:hypothetical protein